MNTALCPTPSFYSLGDRHVPGIQEKDTQSGAPELIFECMGCGTKLRLAITGEDGQRWHSDTYLIEEEPY